MMHGCSTFPPHGIVTPRMNGSQSMHVTDTKGNNMDDVLGCAGKRVVVTGAGLFTDGGFYGSLPTGQLQMGALAPSSE